MLTLVTQIRIPKGNQITKSALITMNPKAGLSVKVPPGYRGATLQVPTEMVKLMKPGDRVAVLSKNVSNIFEVQFACWKPGAVFVPLNWRLAVPELAYIVGDCAPTVMLHGVEFAPQAAQLQVAHRILGPVPEGDQQRALIVVDREDALALARDLRGITAARSVRGDSVVRVVVDPLGI